MKAEFFELEGFGGMRLPAVLWLPEEEVRYVLQITHGMTEHMGRYEDFAKYMTARGIAVAGFDLRGHGKNPGDPHVASCAEGGWTASLADMRLFYEMLERRFPAVPHYMLGFSLGSFLLREYLSAYADQPPAGAAIVGTGYQPGWLLSVMIAIVNGQIKKAGFDGTTDLIRELSFGTYNQKFKPSRTAADWLCAEPSAEDAYLADPLVRRDISAGLFGQLLGSMKRTGRTDAYRGWPSGLPVLLLSGEDDPVGSGGKGVVEICRRMKKAGMEKVTLHLLPGSRHDVFHDALESVCRLVADWIEQG